MESLAGLSGYHCIVDDIVICNQDIAKNAHHVGVFLQRCVDMNITQQQNMHKCKFCQTSQFAGLCLSAEGYQVDTSQTKRQYTNSQHQPAVLICTLSLDWQTSYPHVTAPWHYCWLLCTLCSVQKNNFRRTSHHEDAFMKAKRSLTTAPTLSWKGPHGCALTWADKT